MLWPSYTSASQTARIQIPFRNPVTDGSFVRGTVTSHQYNWQLCLLSRGFRLGLVTAAVFKLAVGSSFTERSDRLKQNSEHMKRISKSSRKESDEEDDFADCAMKAMQLVYGNWLMDDWKLPPLPEGEAGSHPSGQRRYLWVDAFGVLNFVSLAGYAAARDKESEMKKHLAAASKLIEAVHSCLGSPQSEEFPMRRGADGSFEGLRIGKEHSKKVSDAGMQYDGMYWHYLDKWIFALARYATAAQDETASARAQKLIKQVHHSFMGYDRNGKARGLHWKMNVDLTPIPGLDHGRPSSDAISGLISYTALEQALQAQLSSGSCPSADDPDAHPSRVEKTALRENISSEIAEMRTAASLYADLGGLEGGTSDPLGFGLLLWESQFLPTDTAARIHAASRSHAPRVLHPAQMILPFRFYGALLGARLSGESDLTEDAENLLKQVTQIELQEHANGIRAGEREHNAINLVMLASASLPSAFQRLPEETRIL
eukprot:TRINITY_DN65232_c0_g1_i1.p1 TRINITY_DN65232_c0_g1~~TRINITY_DN65232_c0_g1_i1.p1  ORF type:complete len:487 (+),score=89.46 TRINITY_DN65232_c0_g1_i1:66-1526(+)